MAIIGTLPNNIQDGQVADAVPVMADFNFIVSQVNANAQPLNVPPSGTLLNIQTFTASATYAPTAGTNQIVAVLVGGGGAGGGATGTNASQISAAAGGNSATLCMARFASGFSGQPIVIGAGGAPLAGGGGGNGVSSTFLSLTAPGGTGGNLTGTVLTSASAVAYPLAAGPKATGGFLNTFCSLGGTSAFIQNQAPIMGNGADSPLGGGGGIGILNGAGGAGNTSGAGGGGTLNAPSQGNQTGGAGASGICIIYEYS